MKHDPIDHIWRQTATTLGMKIARNADVFASWNGVDTLTICPEHAFDADDSLAQMIFHELCHALVQGRRNLRKIDWGLHNDSPDASAIAEHACHRLQAALSDRYGLRTFFAVTTDWRPYWDALPDDPLAPGDDPAIPLAQQAWPEAMRGRWSAALHRALRATADIADVVRGRADPESLWAATIPRTPVGVAAHPDGQACGSCAWKQRDRCVVHDAPVHADTPACLHHEPQLTASACRTCGACCREGFHMVGVEEGEPVTQHHADLVGRDAHGLHIPRPGGRCVALTSGTDGWTCTIYAQRPRACGDFEIGGDHCLDARRRLGLSRR